MKLLIDMNQSPLWVDYLKAHGVEAVHWSTIGDIRATDMVIMAWAREHGLVVYTHDLDFSALLAATGAAGPSVLQVRTQDILPSGIGADVVRVLQPSTPTTLPTPALKPSPASRMWCPRPRVKRGCGW